MSWEVTLTIGASSYNLHNYSGENLLREGGITKTTKIHKDLKPVQDKATILVDYKVTLSTLLLSVEHSVDCYVEINRDGSAWFTGYLRPLTEITLEDHSTIELEVVDTTELFKRAIGADISYAGYSVCDTSTPASSILHQLFGIVGSSTAGLVSISTTVDYFVASAEDSLYDTISEIVRSYGYVFYSDTAGVVQIYDLSPSSISSSGTIAEQQMLGRLKVSRELVDNDGVEITSRFVDSESQRKIYSSDGFKKYGYRKGSHEVSDYYEIMLSGVTQISEDQDMFLSLSAMNIDFEEKEGLLDDYDWKRGRSLPYLNTGAEGLYSLEADEHRIKYRMRANNNVSPSLRETKVRDLYLFGDVVWSRKSVPAIYPSDSVNPLKIDARWIFDDTAVDALASLYNQRLTDSLYIYAFKSQTEYAPGAYVTISNTTLNVSVTARVLKVRSVAAIVDIYEYEAESVDATVPIVTVLAAGAISITDRVSGPPAGLASSGDIINTIQGNLLGDGFTPTESGLYMSDSYIGFWDNSASEWVARIQNDSGTGKAHFGGDADNYLDWDGTDLSIKGAAEIDGTITATGAVGSANYSAGTTGWQISGDGSAEFNDVTVRGEIEADTGDIAGWEILAAEIRSPNELTRLRSSVNRIQIDDALGTTKVALGYLGSVPGHTSDEFGLYVADGNTVEFSSGASFEEGSYFINSDAAFVATSGGSEAVRLGSLGSGDIGLDIGGMAFGDTLGGGGASGTFGDTLGGGGASGSFGTTLGGGNAKYGSTSGLLFSLADNKMYLSGTLIAVDGEFSGSLKAATGTFSGALEAATGTFSGALEAATGTFSGTVSAGVVSGSTITGGSISIGTPATTSGFFANDSGIYASGGTIQNVESRGVTYPLNAQDYSVLSPPGAAIDHVGFVQIFGYWQIYRGALPGTPAAWVSVTGPCVVYSTGSDLRPNASLGSIAVEIG